MTISDIYEGRFGKSDPLARLTEIVTSPFRSKATEPPPATPAPVLDALASLLAERDRAAAALARFGKFSEGVGAAEVARQSARNALREFEAAETDALRVWAENGEGEAPSRDKARHAELVAAIDQAEREYDDALAASAAVEPAHLRALGALNAVQTRIDERLADSIAVEALAEVDDLAHIVADAVQRFARIVAAREELYRHGHGLQDRGSRERAMPWIAAANRLADVAPVTIAASPQRVSNHVAAWRAKIAGSEG